MSDMAINTKMSPAEMAALNQKVDTFNKSLNEGKVSQRQLDKDDFLKILLTQLKTQDPTDPLKDKDFIAQMAQFSSLEQMTKMATNFTQVSNLLNSNQAVGTLGKDVEIQDGERLVRGTVKEVTSGQYPQVLVDGKFYDYAQVQKIIASEAN